MKRYKRIVILLGVLVIVVAAAIAASRIQERREEIKASGQTFLAIPRDTVTALSFEEWATSLSFHKSGVWLWDDDEAFPVDEEKLERLLKPFENMAAAFVIDDVTDYGQYGLSEPVCTVNLTTGERSYVVKLGDYSSLDSQRYVDIGDGKVYLVADDPLDKYNVEISDLIKHDVIPALDPASFTVSGAAELSAVYDEGGDSYSADDVYFTDAGLPLDTDRVEDWLDRLESLSLTDFVTYNATPEELASCGLDAPGLTVSVTPKDGDPVKIELAALTSEESGEVTSAYARVNDSPIVYSVAPGDYTLIAQAAYNDLRHRELFTADFEAVSSIDVTLEGRTHTFTLEQYEDGTEAWTYNGGEVSVGSISSAIKALSASGFEDVDASGQEEISLTLHLSDEAHPELTITLSRLDGSVCAAKVNGEPVCTVPRSQAVDLIEAVNAVILG